MLAVATAIDAVAVGASLALIKQDPVPLALMTGGVVFVLVMAGVSLGKRVGTMLGSRAGIAGGLVLIAIGVRILLDHGV
jgi:putative Mn2+ efflux pump MntP